MKNFTIVMFVFLITAISGFTQEPSDLTEKTIETYLQALKDPDRTVRHNALTKLNDLKTLYPDYEMKEFDKFLTSKIMKKTTDRWIALLKSETAGVRHSTLHVLVWLKSDFPQLDMRVFNKALEKMVDKDTQKHLQIDAKIALVYLNSPELASAIKVDEENNEGDVFTLIHTEMDKMFDIENPEPR